VSLSAPEWIHLSKEQLGADPSLGEAIERFEAPPIPAGEAASEWLKGGALAEVDHIATYIAFAEEEIVAFYSLAMGELELSSGHRKKLEASHPRPGAVLILWLARAEGADLEAETILRHAVGVAQVGARHVGAAVIALDPFDAATEEFWREKFGFRSSRTKRRDGDGEERTRLWQPLFG
jgi:hypothetical protein